MATTMVKDTKFGRVWRLSGGCKDNWPNVMTGTVGGKYAVGGPETYTLQKPALDSLAWVAGEIAAIGPFKIRKRPVRVTGTARSCALQASLYASDRSRYAPPSVGLHTQALAIDVDTNWQQGLDSKTEWKFKKAMLAAGWTQSRPSDEPWHWSFGWTA